MRAAPRLVIALGLCCALGCALAACENDTTPRPDGRRDAGGQQVRTDAGADAAPAARDAGRDAAARDAGANDAAQPDDDDGGSAPSAPSCGLGEACDLLDPSSCAGGQGCIFALESVAAELPEPQCVDVGAGQDGAICTSYADCSPGLDCTARAGTGECRRYCCALDTTLGCPTGQFCGIALEDASGAPTDVFLCDGCDVCDLTDAAACGAGLGCYTLPAIDACRACLPSGDRAPGAACAFSNDCAPGAACVRAGSGAQRCVAYCNLQAASSCPGSLECRPAAGNQLPSGVGLCT